MAGDNSEHVRARAFAFSGPSSPMQERVCWFVIDADTFEEAEALTGSMDWPFFTDASF